MTSRLTETVASYPTYAEAEHAVNVLADRAFPVEDVTIVAGELRLIEQVTGRRGYGAAALDAAGVGALTGAVVGFVLGVSTPVGPVPATIALALWGLSLGAVIGAVIGVVGHVLEGRRDFTSVRTLDAGRYDVTAPPERAAEARRLLTESSRRAA